MEAPARKLAFTTLFALTALTLSAASPAACQSISFNRVSDLAIKQSHDLVLSRVETSLSKNKIREAKIPYYPTIVGNLNTEYVAGLGQQQSLQNATPVVVGSTILPGNTRFQNAISVNGNYTVADFGARKFQLHAAKQHATSTILQEQIAKRDLRLEVLNAYVQALLTFKELQAKKQQVDLYARLYTFENRKYVAGKISRVELGESAIARSDAEKDFQDTRLRFGEELNRLSSLTHEQYNVETVELDDIEVDERPAGAVLFPHAQLADFKAFDMLVREKQSEIKAIRAQRLPQISLFSSFVLYGANEKNWVNSWGDLSARQLYMGLGVTLPIFDATKSSVAIEEKKLRIAQLIAQRDKRLWELRKDYERNVTAASLYKVEMKTTAQLLTNSQDQLGMVIRLTENQIADKTEALREQIQFLQKKFEAERIKIQQIAALKRMKIYSEA